MDNYSAAAMDSVATVADKELKYWLALWHVKGVGAKRYLALLQAFSTPSKVFSASVNMLCDAGLSHTIASQIKQFDWELIDADLSWLKEIDCHVMCFNDDDYPALLKEISDPPPLLYIRGDRALLSSLQLAMVGARNPTPTAAETAYAFSKSLAAYGLTITSGLALGIDQASHKGALAANGKTIAVAATGLDRVYPARHRELATDIVNTGALVSEFPIGTKPKPGYFPRRNRIISGLSLGVLVVEAAIKSGSLVTARHAMEQGREVFAIPGSIHNPLAKGCHYLIRQGAKLVETSDDVVEELGSLAEVVLAQNSQESDADTDDSANLLGLEYVELLEKISYEPISVDVLIEQSEFTAEEISSMLLVMELQGLVSSAPGGLFYRCSTN